MHFLVVEDEEHIRSLVQMILSRAFPGATLESAACGSEAFRKLEDGLGSPLVVISDFRLGPGPDGLDVLERVARERPDAKRVMVTGSGREELEPRLSRVGVDAFVQKPFRVAEFIDIVEGLVRAARSRERGPG